MLVRVTRILAFHVTLRKFRSKMFGCMSIRFNVFTVLDLEDFAAMAQWCKTNKISLVVVGPEGPLAKGIADTMKEEGSLLELSTRVLRDADWQLSRGGGQLAITILSKNFCLWNVISRGSELTLVWPGISVCLLLYI